MKYKGRAMPPIPPENHTTDQPLGTDTEDISSHHNPENPRKMENTETAHEVSKETLQ